MVTTTMPTAQAPVRSSLSTDAVKPDERVELIEGVIFSMSPIGARHNGDLDFLAEQGTISPGDQDIISFVDTAEAAWKIIADFYAGG